VVRLVVIAVQVSNATWIKRMCTGSCEFGATEMRGLRFI
jgi:hypothetical protein